MYRGMKRALEVPPISQENGCRFYDYKCLRHEGRGWKDHPHMMSFSFSPLTTEAWSTICRSAVSQKHNYALGGHRYKVTYPNGYGASIIKHNGSYGREDDLWELAVLKDGGLCYDTDITDDVLGYLTEEKVIGVCRRILHL